MSNIAQYGSYTVDAAEYEEDELSKGGSGSIYMKLNVGMNIVRILPPPVGRQTPFVTVWQHFIKLPGRAQPVIFTCPNLMQRQFCPACAKRDKLSASPSPMDQEGARDYAPSRRVFMNVIDCDDEDAGPKVLGVGKTIHEALVKIRKNDPDEGDFTNPEKGFNILIERKGTTFQDTVYHVQGARRSSRLKNFDWIGQQPDLQQKLRVPTLDEIKQMVAGPQDEPDTAPSTALPASPETRATRTAQDDIEMHSYDEDIPF